MKNAIHPKSATTEYECGNCGNSIATSSTKASTGKLEVCSNCHPVYTGKQVTSVSGNRVDKFKAKYNVK